MEGEKFVGRLSWLPSKWHRKLRSHKLLATLIVLVVIATLGGATELGYVSLRSQAEKLQGNLTNHLQLGQRELEAGKEALKQANSKHDVGLVSQAIAHFSSARASFVKARQLADDSKLLRYLEHAPSVGDYVRSSHIAVDALAQMGVSISDAGTDLSTIDEQLIKPPAAGDAGKTLLTVLNQAHAGLAKVRNDLDLARKAASGVHVEVLPGAQQATFIKARDSIDKAIAGLDEFERLMPVLTEILGGDRPRTYLVEQVNPAELRAGGGFIGTYSLLRADQGSLKLVSSGDSYDLIVPRPLPWQSSFIPLPTPMRETAPGVSWSFVDSNIYPDFPSNAKAAEMFAQPRVGPIDGVISMDFYTVAKMLELTGPMDVPLYGVRVDSINFIAEAMRHDAPGDSVHKTMMSSLAGPLMEHVSSLPGDRWPALLAMLNGLASERHLQAYFNDDALENEMDRIGWSGRLNPAGYSDFMMEVESNYYGTKSNYWVSRHYSMVLTREGNTLHHSITVDIVNNEPCGIETRTLYKSNVRLYVGADANAFGDNLIRVRYPNPAPPANTRLIDGWLSVGCGGGRNHAAFSFDTPWPEHGKSPHRIYWQKQPGTVADAVDVTWNSGDGDAYHASGTLSQDLVIELSSARVTLKQGQLAQATLPSLGL
jgi:hypothetical protein